MSKVKKKERSGRHVKYNPAEQMRNFCRKVEAICAAVAGPEAVEMLPRSALKRMYKLRVLPLRIVPAPLEDIPEEVLKEMRQYLAAFMKGRKVPLFKWGPEIPFAEAVSVSGPLRFFLRRIEGDPSARAKEFRRIMKPLEEFDEGETAAYQHIHDVIRFIEINHSDIGSRLYWLENDLRFRAYEPWGIENNIMVHSYMPGRKEVRFDGVSRPAIRVSWSGGVFEGVLHAWVYPDKLGMACGENDPPMSIYIQEHALRRLNERLDCITTGTRDLCLCGSFNRPRYRRQEDGSFLIDFMFFDTKAGYLVAEVNGGDLVIKTFLFLTNGGTPEGNRLRNLCEMGRVDIDILAIDRLSTFMATDFRADKRLESMFVEAGCGGLLDIREKAGAFNTRQDMASALPMVRKYFGLDGMGDFMMPDTVERFRRKFDEAWVG